MRLNLSWGKLCLSVRLSVEALKIKLIPATLWHKHSKDQCMSDPAVYIIRSVLWWVAELSQSICRWRASQCGMSGIQGTLFCPPLFPSPRLNILKPNTDTAGFLSECSTRTAITTTTTTTATAAAAYSILKLFDNGRNYWQISFLQFCFYLYVCTSLFPCLL